LYGKISVLERFNESLPLEVSEAVNLTSELGRHMILERN